MAEARPTEERIAELDKKIEQIKAQKKAILQREKQAERKARTKRLIQIGAEVGKCGRGRQSKPMTGTGRKKSKNGENVGQTTATKPLNRHRALKG